MCQERGARASKSQEKTWSRHISEKASCNWYIYSYQYLILKIVLTTWYQNCLLIIYHKTKKRASKEHQRITLTRKKLIRYQFSKKKKKSRKIPKLLESQNWTITSRRNKPILVSVFRSYQKYQQSVKLLYQKKSICSYQIRTRKKKNQRKLQLFIPAELKPHISILSTRKTPIPASWLVPFL